ncbi:cis-prenyltransferase [Acarospora aff. strigata]|nr:cis-prenyltransferase [Acarospora aff. strigata]
MYLSQIRKWLLQSPPVEWGITQLRELLIGALRQGPIPQHVAFVMDGNRRFARNHRIETVEGHNLGFEALARILEVCYKSGVKVVTIYAFSIENFKRSKYEVDALMDMAKVKLSQLAQHGDLLDRYGASIRILGQRELVKPDVLEAIDKAVKLTSGNGKAILNVCFPYTSRDEITTAIRDTVADYSNPLPSLQRPFSESHIIHTIRARQLSTTTTTTQYQDGTRSPSGTTSDPEDSAASSITLHSEDPLPLPHEKHDPDHDHHNNTHTNDPNDADLLLQDTKPPPFGAVYPDPETITPDTLTSHMFTAGTPPLDLLVRTSGVERLSDFMLWQCHQDTDIVFLECLWPEFDLWSFLPVLVEWQWRRRKEGVGKKEQVRERGRKVKVR